MRALLGLHELLRKTRGLAHVAALGGLRRALKRCGVLRGDHLCGFFAVRRIQRRAQLLHGVLSAGLRRKAAEDFILIGHRFPSLPCFVYCQYMPEREKMCFFGFTSVPPRCKILLSRREEWDGLKILVFSDSHGYNMGMAYAVDRETPDAVLHLGDHADDARELERAYPGLAVIRVRGNNDFNPDVPLFAVTIFGGVRMYLTHGHRERVYGGSCEMVAQRAREEGCALAFFGHTHRPQVERTGGVLVCNPGSISLPRGGPASYGRLTVKDGQASLLEILDEDGGLLLREKPIGR